MSTASIIQEALGDQASALRPRKTLAEEATDALRNLILLEKLAPGAPISKQEVAEALGISRTPLHEAMRTLELEGLVEFSATGRPRVADPSVDEIAQYLMVLGALEALAGARACVNATDEEIAEINRLNRKMLETSDTAEPLDFFQTDMEFHRAIVVASRNEPLIETHRQYNARLWRARFLSSRRRPNRPGTLDEHSAIAAALTARDPEASAKALRGHLETAVENISKALQERHDSEKD